MLIVCPKCFTQYLISDEITLSKNQKFHCSTCHNYFTQETESMHETVGEKTVFDEDSVLKAAEADLGRSVDPERSRIVSSDNSAESKPEHEKSDSLFSRPLDLLDKEKPLKEDRLDAVPEEFKPVESPKKGSLFIVFVWLLIVFGVCAGAYYQKDFLIAQIDSLILSQLDNGSKKVSKTSALSKSDQTGNVKTDTGRSVNAVVPVIPADNQKTVAKKEMPHVSLSDSTTEKNQNLPVKETVLATGVASETSVTELVREEAGNMPVVSSEAKIAENVQPTETMPLNQTTVGVADVNVQKQAQEDSNLRNVLKVQEIAYEISPNEVGVERLAIQGEIANTELKEVTLPEYRAVVYDEQDNVVARKRIILSQNKLAGNSTLSFSTAVVPAPETVSRVEVVFDE